MSRPLKSLDTFSVTGTSQRSKSLSRYERVHAKTDSGYHVGRMVQDYEIIQRCFRFRPDEIFKRIRISVIVALISESAFFNAQSNEGRIDEVKNPCRESLIGEANASDREEVEGTYSNCTNTMECPYLLLDVREPEQFGREHIITARNYPKGKLSRVNYETQEMRLYKNHERHIVVVYDDDELVAPQVASTLMQRGYDNIFLLSGGIKVAKHCFPHSLVVPPSVNMSADIGKILISQLQQMSLRYQK